MGRLSGRMLFHKVRPTVLRRHHTHIFYSWESNRSAADIQIPAHTRFGRCFYRQGKDNPGLPAAATLASIPRISSVRILHERQAFVSLFP